MTELEPDDLRWAEDFGARWGAEYPDPLAPTTDISRDAADAANPLLNQMAVARQKRALGIDDKVKLTPEQAAAGAPYLMALAEVVLREVQWALWWRRDQVNRDGNDPGLRYLTYRPKPGFREFLEAVGPTAEGGMRLTPEGGQEATAHGPAEGTTAVGVSEVAPSVAATAEDDIDTARASFWQRWRKRNA